MNGTIYDPYDVPALTDCFSLRMIGIYLIILFLSSILFNSFHFWIFYKAKTLLNPINSFMNALIGLNLFTTVFELPMVVHSLFYCRFVFGKLGCIIEAFMMYFTGCMSIYLVVVISIERNYMLKNPTNLRFITQRICCFVILLCATLSGFWASMPLTGWSHYSLEGVKISCSIEWYSQAPEVMSYNLCMMVFTFTIPVLIILSCNINIILKIRAMSLQFTRQSSINSQIKRRFEKQRNITRLTVLLTALFFISWCPYATVSMYAAFINPNDISPLLATLPALFAKSSLVWPAFLNVCVNKAFKKHLPCMTLKVTK